MTQPSNIQADRLPINVSNVGRPTGDGYRFSDQRIVQHLEVAVASSTSIDQLLNQLGRVVIEQSDCLGLWASQRGEQGEFGAAHVLVSGEGEELWTVVEDHATEMINRVAKTRQICSSPLRSRTETELVVAPVCIEIDPETEKATAVPLMLIGCFSAGNQSALRLQWLLGLVSQSIARWHQYRSLKHMETRTQSLSDTLGLVQLLDQTATIKEASMVIANYLRRVCQSDQVAISFCRNAEPNAKTGSRKPKLLAISDVEQIDASSESNKLVSNACRQTLLNNEELIYPAEQDDHSPALLALEAYCKSNAFESCMNLPLVTEDGRKIGSVLMAGSSEKINNEGFRQHLSHIVKMAAGHLDVVFRANRGSNDVLKSGLRKIKSSTTTRNILIGLACLTGLMFVPLPYRVACDCEVQPVMRRFIAAPHDGVLEETFVQSGDIVEANQVVALLDGRKLRIELSALRAEFDGAKKRRDSALAKGDVALSQIAKSEMKRHSAKMEIIEQQMTNLEVRSTIAGIVVSGDLEKVEGAPLEMGQTLFEVAPLDEMLAEIGIPESEIQYVEAGMEVAIKLNSIPFKTWKGTIELIHPSSEILKDESVFIAQVKISNVDNELRPGMKGSAKIATTYSPIGWNLFHQPWESVRYWLIW